MSVTGALRGAGGFVKDNALTWTENLVSTSDDIYEAGKELISGAPPAVQRGATAAVTLTHQIKHKSFCAALVGTIAGAVVSAVVAAAIVVVVVVAVKAIAVAAVGAAAVAAISTTATTVMTFGLGVAASFVADWLAGDRVKEWVTKKLDARWSTEDGPVATGSSNVWIEGLPAARAGRDVVGCTKHPTNPLPRVAEGRKNIAINGYPLASVEHLVECGAPIKQGALSVLVGGPTVRVCKVRSEFAWWQHALLIAVQVVIPPTKAAAEALENAWRFLGKKALKGIFEGGKLAVRTWRLVKATTIAAVEKGKELLKKAGASIQKTAIKGAELAKEVWTKTRDAVVAGVKKGKDVAKATANKVKEAVDATASAIEKAAKKGAEAAGKAMDKLKSAWDDWMKPPPPPRPGAPP